MQRGNIFLRSDDINAKNVMIQAYSPSDIPELLELLQTRIPDFFHPSELADYEQYLREEVYQYFVWREKNRILGAGGLNYLSEQQETRISWDVVHPSAEGKGIGAQLAQHRIRLAREQHPNCVLIVRTSQLAYGFYEKQGFELKKVEKDYWAEGFDLYQMEWKAKG